MTKEQHICPSCGSRGKAISIGQDTDGVWWKTLRCGHCRTQWHEVERKYDSTSVVADVYDDE